MIAARSLRVVALALTCAALAWVTTAPVFADDRTIAIGADLPLSGIDGADGVPVRNAVQLAVEEENKRGFPRGYRVVLEDLDDTIQGKHDPAQGALNFKTLVADPRVVAVVGPMNSNIATVQIPISNASSLAEISMAATAIGLTHGTAAKALRGTSPNLVTFFRLCASDDRQGELLAHFALGHKWKRAFVIDDNETYGRGVADLFASSFVGAGGDLLGREHLTLFQLDYKPLLTKIAAEHPQAIFFGGIVSTGGAVLRKQMADTALANVPYLGGDGLESPQYVPLTGTASDGTYYSMTAPDVTHLIGARVFLAAYRKRFSAEPSAYSPGAYAAALVALEAIRRTLSANPHAIPSREDIRAAVAATRDVPTPLGPVRFDSDGDLSHPTLSIYRIDRGRTRFVLQTTAR